MMKISSKMWLTPVVALALFGGYAKAAEGGRHAAAFRFLPYAVLAVGTLSPYVPVAAAANAASTKTAADEDKEGIHQRLRGEQIDASIEASFGSWRSDDITHHRSLAKGGQGGNECTNINLELSKTVKFHFLASKNRVNVGNITIKQGQGLEEGTFVASAELVDGCSIDGLHVDVVDGGSLPDRPKPGQMPCRGPAPLKCYMADFNADCCAQSRNMLVHASIQCDERVPNVGLGSAYACNITKGCQDSFGETTQWFNYIKDIPMKNDIPITSCKTGEVVVASCGCVSPSMEFMVVKEVLSREWKTVTLKEKYASPIAVCTVEYDAGNTMLQAVARMKNVGPTSFDIRLQNPQEDLLEARNVHCLVVEQGSWKMTDGRKIEAHKYESNVTDKYTEKEDSWSGEKQYYKNKYDTDPVVLAQVMSHNDKKWSVAWSRGLTKDDPPSMTELFIGKHVGNDLITTRAAEDIGYIVIQQKHAASEDIEIQTTRGTATVKGYNDKTSSLYEFVPSFLTDTVPAVAVLSQVGMKGKGGSWAVLQEISTSTSMKVAVDFYDSELEHKEEEQLDYFVSAAAGAVKLMLPDNVNDSPVAVNDAATTYEDVAAVINPKAPQEP